MYTLNGSTIETLADLQAYCEEPNYLEQKKKVILHEADPVFNDRAAAEDPYHQTQSATEMVRRNNASFIFNPLKNDLANISGDPSKLRAL